jgi:hypothetical protein
MLRPATASVRQDLRSSCPSLLLPRRSIIPLHQSSLLFIVDGGNLAMVQGMLTSIFFVRHHVLLVFLSGAAALIYQVVWVRSLSLASSIDTMLAQRAGATSNV